MFKSKAQALKTAATGGAIALLLAASGLLGAGLAAITPAPAGTPWIYAQATSAMQAVGKVQQ